MAEHSVVDKSGIIPPILNFAVPDPGSRAKCVVLRLETASVILFLPAPQPVSERLHLKRTDNGFGGGAVCGQRN